jgi:hypothetical protein
MDSSFTTECARIIEQMTRRMPRTEREQYAAFTPEQRDKYNRDLYQHILEQHLMEQYVKVYLRHVRRRRPPPPADLEAGGDNPPTRKSILARTLGNAGLGLKVMLKLLILVTASMVSKVAGVISGHAGDDLPFPTINGPTNGTLQSPFYDPSNGTYHEANFA